VWERADLPRTHYDNDDSRAHMEERCDTFCVVPSMRLLRINKRYEWSHENVCRPWNLIEVTHRNKCVSGSNECEQHVTLSSSTWYDACSVDLLWRALRVCDSKSERDTQITKHYCDSKHAFVLRRQLSHATTKKAIRRWHQVSVAAVCGWHVVLHRAAVPEYVFELFTWFLHWKTSTYSDFG